MILFIHGFGSCGWGAKSLRLRRHFGVDRVLAPDLPCDPEHAIAVLRRLRDRYPITALVGSSLGGFYATWLNADHHLPTVLINPVVRPQALFDQFIGRHRRWCDQAEFRVTRDHLATLRRLQRDALGPDERYLVLLQQGDEVLDYRQAADYYRGKDVVQLPGGSHRFDQLERQLSRISDWLALPVDDHAEAAATAD